MDRGADRRLARWDGGYALTESDEAEVAQAAAGDVELARGRDAEAFARVYFATADRIHALARWLLGSHDVDDVVQEVYVRAWQRLPELRDPAAFGAWLRRLAVHVILRWRERSSRRGRREEASASLPQVADTGGTRIDLRMDLERAVARLPPQARKVFVLYDVEGWPHLDIANSLGITHHTSRSQLHRARALLKRFLLEKEEA